MARYSERLLGRADRRRPLRRASTTTRSRLRCWSSPSSRACPRRTTPSFAEGFSKVPEELEHKPLEFLYEQFSAYIEDRRREPRDDIMTKMATATFPDGGDARGERRRPARRQPLHRRPGDHRPPALVRAADPRRAPGPPGARCARDRELIPNFIEETLRYESPLRAQFRMAKVRTTVAGVDIPAGSTMLLLPGAANRDPRKFDRPGHVRPRAGERDLPPGLRPRHPPLRRRPPGPGRGAGHDQPAARPARRASRSPRPPTARPMPAAGSTSRPTSCGASSDLELDAHAGVAAQPLGDAPISSLSCEAGGPAVVPPSTGSTMPVIWADRSLARKRAASATSSGLALAGQRLGELQHRVHVVGGHRRLDLPGDEAVHPDAVLRDVEGDRTGGVDHGGLRGPVGDEARRRR